MSAPVITQPARPALAAQTAPTKHIGSAAPGAPASLMGPAAPSATISLIAPAGPPAAPTSLIAPAAPPAAPTSLRGPAAPGAPTSVIAPAAPSAARLAPTLSLRAWGGNLGLAACYLLFSWGMLIDFMQTHRISSLILTFFESLIVFYSLFRPAPKQSNTSLYDWSVALAGTFILLLLRPAPQVHDHAAIIAVQLVGMSISLAALFSLNKSFGLVAANRGVKKGGLYSVVRHPIYAGYFISFAAYVAQNPTVNNAVLYVLFVCLELLRVAAEERVLSGDPEYVSYARATRWRVIPFVY